MKITRNYSFFRSHLFNFHINRRILVIIALFSLWASPAFAAYTPFNANVSGNIGVGTSTPQAKFVVVNGNVGIGTWTAGGGNLIVNGGGNVGIGSAWPGQLLDVQGTVRALAFSGNGSLLTNLPAGGAAGITNQVQYNNSGNLTGSNNFIFDGTNVGIGSTAPGQSLDVQGSVRATNFIGNGSAITNLVNAGTAGQAAYYASSTNTVSGTSNLIFAGSNVGIGSAAPGQALDVQGTIRTTGFVMSGQTPASGYVLTAIDSTGTTTWSAPGTVGGWSTGTGTVFTTTGSNNVGIGSTAPGQKLDVQGTVRALFFSGNGSQLTNIPAEGAAGSTTQVQYNNGGNIAANSNFVFNGTNVGIGTTLSANTLDVATNVSIGTAYAGYKTAPPNGLLVQGNVGIGSANPGQALDVNGTIRSILGGYIFPDGSTQTTAASGGNSWSMSAGNIYTTTGSNNVGIGTSTPQGGFVVTNGNVGIGTWAPTAALTVGINAFTVNSTGAITATTGITTIGGYTQSGSGVNSLSGNVGIGSTAPGQALDVQGTVRTTGFVMSGQTPMGGYVLTAIDSTGTTTWSAPGTVGGWSTGTGTVYTTTGSNNVGIGSTTPGQKLDVQGTVRALFFSGNGSQLTNLSAAGSTTQVQYNNAGSIAANSNFVFNGTNVGIGTTLSTNTLDVATNVSIGTAYAGYKVAPPNGLLVQGNVGIGSTNPGQALDVQGIVRNIGEIVNGNVGIGSAAPGQALDVQGTIRTTGFVMSGQTPMGGYVLTAIDSTGTTTWSAPGTVGGWSTGTGTVFTTTGSNNVGIGSTAPGQKLDVQGTVRALFFSGNGSQLTNIPAEGAAGSTTQVQYNNGGNIAANSNFVFNGTNVGIGTTLSTNTLDVATNVSIGTAYAGYKTAPPNGLLVQGNVGIGSANPGQALDVNGTIRSISGGIMFPDGSTQISALGNNSWSMSGGNVYTTNGSNNVGIGTNTPQGGFVVTNGNVGIGTWAPTSALTVGINAFTVNSTGAIATIGGYTQTGTGINSLSGNVGIGSTAPGQVLDVQGTIRTTGFVMSGQTPMGGYVLTAIDSTGATTWSAPGTVGGWSTGVGTVYTTTGSNNVGIGTSTPQGGLVVTNGNVGIGTWAPANTLSLAGNLGVNFGSPITQGEAVMISGGMSLGQYEPFNRGFLNLRLHNNTDVGISIQDDNGHASGVNNNFIQLSDAINTIGVVGEYGANGELNLNGLNGLTLQGNGSLGVYVSTAGNVGIGSAAPGQVLDVQGTARIIGFNMPTGKNNGYVLTSDANGNGVWAAVTGSGTVNSGTTNRAAYYTGATAVSSGTYFDNGTNIGIGTILNTNLLDVAGGVTIGTTYAGYKTAPTNGLIVQGNVGIGSTNPGQALDVNGTIRSISGGIMFPDGSTQISALGNNSWSMSGGNVYTTNGSNNVGIGTSTPQGGFVVTNGNVGIGTWAPNMKLSIQGGNVGIGTLSAPAKLYVMASSASDVVSAFQGTVSQSGDLMEWTNSAGLVMDKVLSDGSLYLANNGGNSYNFTVDANAHLHTGTEDIGNTLSTGGNVGIGTSAFQTALAVTNGNVGIGTWTASNILSVVGGVSVGSLTYANTAAPLNGIIVSGNVGIGSVTPGQALDVQGTIRTTGFVMSGQTPVSGYVLTAIDGTGTTTWSAPGTVGGWSTGTGTVFTTIGSNNVGIGTSTPQGALVVTNGNVGIGTWAPSYPLDIVSTNAGAESVALHLSNLSGSVGTASAIGFTAFNGTTITGKISNINNSGLYDIALSSWNGSSDAEHMRITSQGNVGIGTATPSAMLHIYPGANSTKSLIVQGDNNQSSDIQEWQNNAGISLAVVSASGNIGIGSLHPGQALDVNGTIRSISGGIMFPDGSTQITALGNNSWSMSGGNVYTTTGSNNVGIGTSTPQGGLVVTNGNVGIGTWAPATGLQVMDNFSTGDVIRVQNSSVSGYSDITFYDNTSSLQGLVGWGNASAAGLPSEFFLGTHGTNPVVFAVNNGEVGRFSSGGNLGIGTSLPSGLLEVGNQKFDVLAGGNVGIGSITPGQALDVQGTVRATGFIAGAAGLTLNGVTNTSWPAAGSNYWLNTAAAGNVGISTTNTVGIGTTSGVGAGLVVMNGNVGIGTWAPRAQLDVEGTLSSVTFAGNVGIGTWVPSAVLTVQGQSGQTAFQVKANGSIYGSLTVDQFGDTEIGVALISTLSSSNSDGYSFGGTGGGEFADNYLLTFSSNNTYNGTADTGLARNAAGVMEIDNATQGDLATLIASNIGIGTVAAVNQLTVNGAVGIGTSNSSYVTTIAPVGGLLVQGNVGIGSLHPGQALDVNGTIRSISGGIMFPDGSTQTSALGNNSWSMSGGNVYTTTGSNNVGIGTSTPQGGLVVTNGNVGIGTFAPIDLLQVGSVLFVPASGTIVLNEATQTNNVLIANQQIQDNSSLYASNIGIGTSNLSTSALTVMAGNVGIGTWVPRAQLDVEGTLSTAIFNGNVGIGTAVPLNNARVSIQATIDQPQLYIQGTTTQSSDVMDVAGHYYTLSVDYNGEMHDNSIMVGSIHIWGAGIGTTFFSNDTLGSANSIGINEIPTITPTSGTNYALAIQPTYNETSGTAANTDLLIDRTETAIGSGAQKLIDAQNGGVTKFEVDHNGNVGIGTFNVSSGSLIVTSGNVGIGSLTPGVALDVQGTIRALGLTLNGVTNTSWPAAGSNYWLNTAAAGNVGISTTNTVGIGTTSGVGAGLVVMNGNVGIGTWAPAGLLQINNQTNTPFLVDTNGNVGIGTTKTTAQGLTIMNGNVGIGTWVPYTGSSAWTAGITVKGSTSGVVTGLNVVNDSIAGAQDQILLSGSRLDVNDYASITYTLVDGGNPLSNRLEFITGDHSLGGISFYNTRSAPFYWYNNPSGTLKTEVMRLDGNGNLGIGTASPGNTNGLSVLGGESLGAYATNTAPAGGLIVSGNVGIGSVTPGQALDVQGTVRATGFIAGAAGITLGGVNNTSWPASGSNYWLNTAAAGNVGISTTNTVGIGTTSGIGAGLVVMNGNVGIGTWVPGSTLEVGNQKFDVMAGGNVGLGTINPYVELQVNQPTGSGAINKGILITGDEVFQTGHGDATGGVRIAVGVNRSGNRQIWIGDNDAYGSSTLSVFRYLTGQTNFATLDAESGDGNNRLLTILGTDTSDVGIGYDTTAVSVGNYTAKLNDFTASADTTTVNMLIKKFSASPTSDYLDVSSSTSTLFDINSLGNVGIGSATPGVALDVQGTVRATGFIAGAAGITLGGVNNTSWPASGSNYWLNTAAAGNVGISTTNTVGIGTTSGVGAGLVVMNGNVGIGTWAPAATLDVNGMFGADGAASITATPPSVGTNVGWKIGLYGTNYDIGIASLTMALNTSGWVSIFGGSPANNASSSAPDTNAKISFNSSNGSGLFSGNVGIGTIFVGSAGEAALSVMNGNVGIGTWTANSGLQLQQSFAVYRTGTAASASTAGQTIIGVTDTTSARTITLANADKVFGRVVIVKDESGGAATNNITVTPATGTIDGATSVIISANYGVVRLYSDGTNWFTF